MLRAEGEVKIFVYNFDAYSVQYWVSMDKGLSIWRYYTKSIKKAILC